VRAARPPAAHRKARPARPYRTPRHA